MLPSKGFACRHRKRVVLNYMVIWGYDDENYEDSLR